MSALPEQPAAESEQDSVRVGRYASKIEDILELGNLAQKLYRDRKLTKREIDAKLIEFGYQVALRQLIASACNPDAPQSDIKALDLFLKRCDLYFSANEERTPNPDEPAPFKTRKGKSATTSSEHPSSDYVEGGGKTASDGESTRAK